MAWTAPMTAIAGSVFTAAQFNTFIRDNLAETAPAKATTPGAHFAVSDTNQIAERIGARAEVLTSETTTSTSYTDLATVGPQVTVTTGPSALVYVHGSLQNSGTSSSRMAYVVSGASSIAEQDNRGIGSGGDSAVFSLQSGVHFHTDLTPGVNTFKAVYRVAGGTGTFLSRRIGVIPF